MDDFSRALFRRSPLVSEFYDCEPMFCSGTSVMCICDSHDEAAQHRSKDGALLGDWKSLSEGGIQTKRNQLRVFSADTW